MKTVSVLILSIFLLLKMGGDGRASPIVHYKFNENI